VRPGLDDATKAWLDQATAELRDSAKRFAQ